MPLLQTYEPTKWWWESKELLRKFFFCGILMLLGPTSGGSSPDQICLGFLFGMMELTLYATYSP